MRTIKIFYVLLLILIQSLSSTDLIAQANSIILKNMHTNRYALSTGDKLANNGKASGGWTGSPAIVGTDANYYGRAEWILIPVTNTDYFQLKNKHTNRYLFCPSEVMTYKRGSDGGWAKSKSIIGADANYYSRANWKILKTGNNGYQIINVVTNRMLLSTGDKPTKSEGGWLKSPALVGSDANYYNRGIWNITGNGLSLIGNGSDDNQATTLKDAAEDDHIYTISMVCKNSAESDRSVEIYGNLALNVTLGSKKHSERLFSRSSSSTQKLHTNKARFIKKGVIRVQEGSTLRLSGSLSDEDDSPNPDDPLGSVNKILNVGKNYIYFKEKGGDTKVEVIVEIRKDEIQEYEKGNAFSNFESMINKFDNGSDNKPEEFKARGTSSNHMFTHYSAGIEHCQGVTKAGKNYVISHDTRKGITEGLLVICKPNGDAVFHTFGKSNHPGAIQACGDIVIVPMSNENKTYFIDVSNPDNPITLDITLPAGGGAAGLVYHQTEKVHYALVGSGANSADRLYKSNGESLTSPKCSFTLVSSTNIRARQGMSNLVYDPTNSSIYMIAMERNVDDNARETLIIDKIVVGTNPDFSNVNKIGFSSYPGNSWNYAENSRWGAGLVDLGNGNFELIAIARLLTGGPAANYVQMQRWKLP